MCLRAIPSANTKLHFGITGHMNVNKFIISMDCINGQLPATENLRSVGRDLSSVSVCLSVKFS
jgi:hypothetical protein